MLDSAGKIKTNLFMIFAFRPHQTVMKVLVDQQKLIYNNSERREDVVWKTYRKRRMVDINSDRDSGKSVPAV